MKPVILPKSINPVQLATRKEQVQGRLSLVQCERLSPLLRENTGSVDFLLQFMQDEAERAIVKVAIRAELVLECRRCLQSMTYPLDVTVDLAVVADNEAAVALPECYEPLLVVDDEVAIESLIEDELLLNLPVMPGHPEEECSVALPTKANQDTDKLEERKNPFADLNKLLRSD